MTKNQRQEMFFFSSACKSPRLPVLASDPPSVLGAACRPVAMREEFQRRGPLYINGVYAGRAQAASKNVERFDERWAISEIAAWGC